MTDYMTGANIYEMQQNVDCDGRVPNIQGNEGYNVVNPQMEYANILEANSASYQIPNSYVQGTYQDNTYYYNSLQNPLDGHYYKRETIGVNPTNTQSGTNRYNSSIIYPNAVDTYNNHPLSNTNNQSLNNGNRTDMCYGYGGRNNQLLDNSNPNSQSLKVYDFNDIKHNKSHSQIQYDLRQKGYRNHNEPQNQSLYNVEQNVELIENTNNFAPQMHNQLFYSPKFDSPLRNEIVQQQNYYAQAIPIHQQHFYQFDGYYDSNVSNPNPAPYEANEPNKLIRPIVMASIESVDKNGQKVIVCNDQDDSINPQQHNENLIDQMNIDILVKEIKSEMNSLSNLDKLREKLIKKGKILPPLPHKYASLVFCVDKKVVHRRLDLVLQQENIQL